MAGGVPAGLRRWLLSGWLRAGFDAFMTWAAIRQASGRKSSLFRPVSFCSLHLSSLDVLAFSCWLYLFDLGGQAGGIGAAGGVSIWPGRWAYRALLRHGAGRAALVPCLLAVSPAGRAGAVRAGAGAGAGHGRRSQANRLANRQNAQRFNKKCSIMTKMMPCILYFLCCKYACFCVKWAVFLTFWI